MHLAVQLFILTVSVSVVSICPASWLSSVCLNCLRSYLSTDCLSLYVCLVAVVVVFLEKQWYPTFIELLLAFSPKAPPLHSRCSSE